MPGFTTGRVVLLGLALLAAGCSSVRVSNQSSTQTLLERQASILDRERISEPSLRTLSLTGQDQPTCLARLADCLNQLRQVPEVGLEDYLSTASELYLAHMQALQGQLACQPERPEQNGQRVSTGLAAPGVVPLVPTLTAAQRQQCQHDLEVATLEAVRHAYAYLFAQPRPLNARLFTTRQQQVLGFYHLASARWIERHWAALQARSVTALPVAATVSIQSTTPLIQSPASVDLIAANTLNFSGLRSINRRDGLGVEFVATLPEPAADAPTTSASHLHRSTYMPLTALMQVQGNSLQAIMRSQQFVLSLHDPLQTEQVSLLGQTYPLAANFSAPYGLWLARNDLNRQAYRHLLGDFGAHQDSRPQLYLLEPYDPDKRVILLIHGIASSPEAWLSLTNDILGDPVLRRHYQVWQVFYPTNLPILENRYQIQQLIREAYRQTDPQGRHPASQQSVLIGHSMGGVIARMLVSPTDLTADMLPSLSAREQAQLRQVPEIADRLRLSPLPQVGRAVFVAAPFRGTDYADKWFTRLIRRTLQLPASFSDRLARLVSGSGLPESVQQLLRASGALNLENGASDLSSQSRFNQVTRHVQVRPGLPFHLMMGRSDLRGPLAQSSDGIVPYQSAHLDGAVSEKVLEGGHSIQLAPEAVVEFRRILRQHLIALGDMPPESRQLQTLDSPLGLSRPEAPLPRAPAVMPVSPQH